MSQRPLPLRERPETVAVVWPPDGTPPASMKVAPYGTRFTTNRAWFDRVQAASGWNVTDQQWSQLSTELVPESMVFVERGGEPVAVACALEREDDWRELAWVAVASEHRGRRLGTMVCAALIRRLLAAGHDRVFGSTQGERLAALRIYLEIGFHPVHREGKVDRWRAICDELGRPFTPRTWQWPLDVS